MVKCIKNIQAPDILTEKLRELIEDTSPSVENGVEELTFHVGDDEIPAIYSVITEEHRDEGSGMGRYFHLWIFQCDPNHLLTFEKNDYDRQYLKPANNMIISFDSHKAHALTSDLIDEGDMDSFERKDVHTPLMALSMDTSKPVNNTELRNMFENVFEKMKVNIENITCRNIFNIGSYSP